MYYYERFDDRIDKYELTFNKDDLEKLKKEIIDNCCEITHYDCNSIIIPLSDRYLKIKKLKYKPIGLAENNDFYTPDDILYHLSYDEYKYPKIVGLIDKLLKEDPDLDLNYDEELTVEEQIDKATREYEQIPIKSVEKRRIKKIEIDELLDKRELNVNQVPVDNYYLRLQDIIHMKHIGSIKLNEVSNSSDSFENNDERVIRRILRKDNSIKK